MLRRLIALFAFVMTFVAASTASAAVVRDAEKFSVDTGAARICWISPLTLRNAEDCDGLTPDAVPQPAEGKARVLAMGLLRLEEPGAQPDLALVMVMHVDVSYPVEPDDDAAREYGEGAQRGVQKALRNGARMRPANARLVNTPRLHYPLIRVVLDADGIPDGADDQLLEHQVHVAGVSEDGVYSVAYLAKRRDAKQVAAYADAIAPSFHMTKPAKSSKELDKKLDDVAAIIVLVGTLLVGGVIAIIVVVSRRNTPAPYAYPHPYHAQPSSYPPPAWHPASVQAHAYPQHPYQPQYQPQHPPQYQPRHYSMPAIPPPPAVPRREWWDELQ